MPVWLRRQTAVMVDDELRRVKTMKETKRKTMAKLRLSCLALTVVACSSGPDTSPGVSWELAKHRKSTISNVRYELTFSIPSNVEDPIAGTETARFELSDARRAVVFDFTGPAEAVTSVAVDGQPVEYTVVDQHVIVPPEVLREGEVAIAIDFEAGNGSLNRNDEFLYTLFVPDRARTAFPTFDQPNLKARYQLTLEVPDGWEAVSNAEAVGQTTESGRKRVSFAETEPISTYLFAFAAGRFQIETAERDGRRLQLYHRETDAGKVARNLDAIFDLHATALSWLEEYTDIPYPFGKFDFVAIPSFQYGGMEHPGSILYRSASLFLDESATQSQYLGRASLIAHETAHMWFGDLVTMDWFDDVWMKEVFANFMAAKIVNPSFPDIDHDLRFFLAHHPSAYGIDRTDGANPIRQELDNLNEAGTLYGAIIYQKAPIVMKHLEQLIGEAAMRGGLREYLSDFLFDNATWLDLIAILDQLTNEDLESWSRVWVEVPGRPTVTTDLQNDEGDITQLHLTQADPMDRDLRWTQRLSVTLGYPNEVRAVPVVLSETSTYAPDAAGLPTPAFMLAGGDGVGYAHFPLDAESQRYLVGHLPDIEDGIARSVAWVSLWESVLYHQLTPATFIDAAMEALPQEDDEQNVQRVLGFLRSAFWRFLDSEERGRLAPRLEQLLWSQMELAQGTSRKAAFFNAYVAVAMSPGGTRRLADIWHKQIEIDGMPLAERHFSSLAQGLAVRGVSNAQEILDEQLERIENPDRRARFLFVMPALSADESVRDSVFESLKDARNRAREPWTLSVVSLLHHPLRSASSEKYILPSLELVEEIQQTGDIFFPLRWLNSTLDGHRSPAAASIVREFLAAHLGYPPRLRGKILQAADGLFRAAEMP